MENILFLDIDDSITKPSVDDKDLTTEEFNKMILTVKPNLETIAEVKNIARYNDFDIVFNTGRSEVIRAETLAWLKRYFEAPIKLLMRPTSVGFVPEQIYNSKVQQITKYLKGKEYDNLLFIDNSITQLKRYIQNYPNDGAYSVENGKINRGFYPSPIIDDEEVTKDEVEELEEIPVEEEAIVTESGFVIPLSPIGNFFDD